MKNRIAVKLMFYFSSVLLIFALLIGGLFYQLFKQHTIEIKKQSMIVQSQKIAAVISDNMHFLEKRYGDGISNSRFIKYLDNVSRDMVWVVDSERNLNVNKERMREQMRKHHDKGIRMPNQPRNAKYAYNKLPEHIKDKVEQGFKGERFIIEEYNSWLNEFMITVGEPVYDEHGEVKAVLLLHSPVQGLHDAVWSGLRILMLSVLAALVLGLFLSIILSWRFTKPLNLMNDNAALLAERNYSVRNNITQKDEIGALAQTLDVLAERLQLADEESQKLEKLRREFIANISHELRTPVTVIRGSLEALRDGVITEKEEVNEFHEQMYKESIFLQRLINDLLDLSRLQNTDFPIEKSALNFCDVVQDAVRGSRRIGMEKHIQVKADLDADLYMLDGDYGRLRQMLMIFLHNSIKFSPEGGEIMLHLKSGWLQIIDHGCGMNAEELPHAFDRFYKARNEHNKTGSGLGLAIAKQIALRHDMGLSVESEKGKGTTINIILPPALTAEELAKMEEQHD